MTNFVCIYAIDIKPENILIWKNPLVVKLTDFGLSRIINPSKDIITSESNAMHDAYISKSDIESERDHRSSTSTDMAHSSSQLPVPPLNRNLTQHVVSRWYRAPEVILLQQYAEAVDVRFCICILCVCQISYSVHVMCM